MPLQSMTGFAALEDQAPGGWRWRWELRSVNARGLDCRLRLPQGFEALDPPLRRVAQSRFRRGTLTATATLSRAAEGGAAVQVDAAGLEAALRALSLIRARAEAAGLSLATESAAALLSVRGVLAERHADQPGQEETAALGEALAGGFERTSAALADSRAEEGARLESVLRARIDTIAALTDDAARQAGTTRAAAPDRLRAQVAALLGAGAPIDKDRLAQELAQLAVKGDVSEEIDRLRGHVTAARALLDAGGPIGRRLDFLTQEFNREANTLCAKSTSADLTRIGLDLKVTIDQVREQAQNVE